MKRKTKRRIRKVYASEVVPVTSTFKALYIGGARWRLLEKRRTGKGRGGWQYVCIAIGTRKLRDISETLNIYALFDK